MTRNCYQVFIIMMILVRIYSNQLIEKPIISSFKEFGCQVGQSNQQLVGEKVLQNSSTEYSQITVVGWFKIRGNMNYNYNLISILNQESTELIILYYNPIQMYFKADILNDQLSTSNLYLDAIWSNDVYGKWIFIRVGINLNINNSGQFFIYFIIQTVSQPYAESTPYFKSNSGSSSLKLLDNSSFQILYGDMQYKSLMCSCYTIKKLSYYLGISNDITQGARPPVSQQELDQYSKLVMKVNFYRITGTSLSINFINEIILQEHKANKIIHNRLVVNDSPVIELKDQNNINLGIFSFDENDGIFISLDVRISNNFDGYFPQFVDVEQDQRSNFNYRLYSFCVSDRYGNGKYYFFDLMYDEDTQIGIEMTKGVWYRLTISLQIVFNQIRRRLYLYESLEADDYFPLNHERGGQVSMNFINYRIPPNEPNTRRIQIKQIKIFQGTHFENVDNCLMQMDLPEVDCIVCNAGYNLIQGFKQYCFNKILTECPNSSFQVYSLKSTCEWDDNQPCPHVEQFRLLENQCSCLATKYKNNLICSECPEYCNSCSSSTECIDYFSERKQNGQCQNDEAFDDGKSCISEYLKIPNRSNLKSSLKYQTINSSFSYNISDFKVKDKAFQIGNESNGFFISFRFFIDVTNYNSNDTATLCYMEEAGQLIFIITLKYISSDNISLQLFIFGNLVITAQIEASVDIWYGFYTDLKNIVLILKQDNSPVSYYKSEVTKQLQSELKDAFFVFGAVTTSLHLTTHKFNGQFQSNYWVIGGHHSMLDFYRQLSYHSNEDLARILDFQFTEYESNIFLLNKIIQNKLDSSLYMNFLDFGTIQDNIKGIQIMSKNVFNIQLKNLNMSKFAIQLSFSDLQLNFDYLDLIKLKNGSGDTLFKFGVQYNSYSKFISFTVCIKVDCRKLKYITSLSKNGINQLFIQIEPIYYKNSYDVVRIHIILNYKFEVIEFESYFIKDFTPNEMFIFSGDLTPDQQLFYLSRLQVYKGAFYYIDYDNYDPCFLYINRENMECILPKQGYSLKGDEVVVNDKCNEYRLPTLQDLYYNPYTMTCQDSIFNLNNCSLIDFSDLSACIKCIDDLMEINNDCNCPQTYFFDSVLKKCKKCPDLCQKCSDQNVCEVCIYSFLEAPNCNCTNESSYYDLATQSCQSCQIQCKECQSSANNCTVCNENRINIPYCTCDTSYKQVSITQVSEACEILECSFKCLTCAEESDNCVKCDTNRYDPPNCSCLEGMYDDQKTCISCGDNQYYNFESQRCTDCNKYCLECSGPYEYNCISCQEGFYLNIYNECECYQGGAIYTNNSFMCFKTMNITAKFQQNYNTGLIEIEFDEEVDNLQWVLDSNHIKSILEISISEVPKEYYSIQYISSDNVKVISIEILFTKSIQATLAYILFVDNKLFLNNSKQYILDPKYKKYPLNLNIGPFIFLLSNSDQQFIDKINELSPTNQSFLSFMRNLQFLFYFLNSVQPTAIFLLVKINIPINLYTFLQLFGTFVYKDMPNQQEQSQLTQFAVLNYEVSKFIQSSGDNQFDRLGFRDSFLVNCEYIIYKYLTLVTMLVILIIAKQYKANFFKKTIKNKKTKISQAQEFIVQRINSENEVNLLFIVFCFCLQISNIDQSNWLNRWGLYAALIIFLIFSVSGIWLFLINNNNNEMKDDKENFDLNEKNYVKDYQNRLDSDKVAKNKLIRNYHFLYHIKKIILLLLVFSMRNYPQFLSIFGVIINFVPGLLTIIYQPYKYLLQSIVKGVGEILLSIAWVFYILFYNFNQNIQGNVIMKEEDVETFLNQGFYLCIILLIFNLLYVINLIVENLVIPLLESRKEQKKKVLPQILYKEINNPILTTQQVTLKQSPKQKQKTRKMKK